MKKQLDWQDEQGSSLIEVIIAITVVSFVALFFIKYFYQAEQAAQLSDRKLIAATLARQEVEKWKLGNFTDILQDVDSDLTDGISVNKTYPFDTKPVLPFPQKLSSELDQVNGTTYHTIVTVSSLDGIPEYDAYDDLLLKVNVTVTWLDEAEYNAAADKKRVSSSVEAFIAKEVLRR
jgi:type II secretory pathway pseudopilin PulG